MYKCSECGNTEAKWIGKCPSCNNWNTLIEVEKETSNGNKKTKGKTREVFNIMRGQEDTKKIEFSSIELNNVLGGGLTLGSLILLSGEPGIGKSTLSLQIADWFSSTNKGTLYISAEENIYQLSSRAKRLKINSDSIHILNSSNLEDIIETIKNSSVELIIVDSISVISSFDINSSSGTVSQIKYITERFMELAKKLEKSIILVGHVTKDGTIGGPKTLEHLVDIVLYLEGSRFENYRILRSFKNRFGPTDEIGLFTMTENGMQDLINPGLEFITKDSETLSGSAIAMTTEGNRCILVEVEALTTYTKFGYPKRSSRGINGGKLDLLIAVITKFSDIKLESYDVYINISRGLSINEPAIDLATIAAIISSKKGKPLGKTVFIGEVSLTGIVKNVLNLQKRIDESIKLGIEKIIIPAGFIDKKILKKGNIIEVKNIKELEKIIS